MDREEKAREAVREFLALAGGGLNDEISGPENVARRRAARAGVVHKQGRLRLTGENTDELATLVSEAKVSPVAWAACCVLLDDLIQADKPIPDELSLMARDVLRGEVKRPTRRGPNPLISITRNNTIQAAVFLAMEQGLPAYHNGNSGRLTACELVSAELKSTGTFLSVDEVVTIWKKRPRFQG